MPTIICPEDNGNIDIIDTKSSDNIRLNIRPDTNNPIFFQWFNFFVQGNVGESCIVNIENAHAAKYPGWNEHKSYRVYASYEDGEWFFVDTVYDEKTGKLTMTFDLKQEKIQLAYFPPYNYERHLKLIEQARAIQHCQVSVLGKTNGEHGRDITLLTFGKPAPQKKNIWVIARQHPGEPQAEFFAEGLVEHLASNPEFLEEYTVYIVPNMNPDGTYDGNLRTNKEGADLNRMWLNPTSAESPEVVCVLDEMHKTGVDLFIDVHGDEVIPYPFLDRGHLSAAKEDKILEAQETAFLELFVKMSKHMQNELNYGETNRNDYLTLAAVVVGDKFHCPSLTLEQPIKESSWQDCKTLAIEFFDVVKAFYLQHANVSAPKSPLTSLKTHPFLSTTAPVTEQQNQQFSPSN